MVNENLFAALRAAFPANLDALAVETAPGLGYSWRDLERATAMLANLLDSLAIPKGARVAVQVEKSVEAMLLYLATLRAGYVFLPLNTAYQSAPCPTGQGQKKLVTIARAAAADVPGAAGCNAQGRSGRSGRRLACQGMAVPPHAYAGNVGRRSPNVEMNGQFLNVE